MPMLASLRRLSAPAFLALSSAVLVSRPSEAAFLTQPPEIKFKLNKSSIDFGDVALNKLTRDSFRIVNDSSCPMRMNFSGSGSQEFSTVCFGLTNLGEIAAGSEIGCQVDFLPQTPGPQSRIMTITLSYGPTCRSRLFGELTAEHEAQQKPLVEQRDALQSAGPDTKDVDVALQREERRIELAIEKLQAEHRKLNEDSPEIRKAIEERLALLQSLHDRIGALNEQWNRLKQQGPNFDVVTKLLAVKESKFKLDDQRLQQSIDGKRANQRALAEQQRVALEELRKGRCGACPDTESEYRRKGRDQQEPWESHVARNGLRLPTPQELAEKKKEYDDKIAVEAAAIKRLQADRAALKARYDRDLADLKAKTKLIEDAHAKRLDDLQAQISAVRKEMSARITAVETRITDLRNRAAQRQVAIKKEIAALETARKDAQADHKRRVAKIKLDHAAAIAKLVRSIESLGAQFALAERTLKRRLEEKKSDHLSLTGKGVQP